MVVAQPHLLLFPVGTTPGDISNVFGIDSDAAEACAGVLKEPGGAYKLATDSEIEFIGPCPVSVFRFAPKGFPMRLARSFVPQMNTKHGIVFGHAKRPVAYQLNEGRLQMLMKIILEVEFEDDTEAMAARMEMEPEDLESVLEGIPFRTTDDVRDVAERLNIDSGYLLKLWEEDALKAIEFLKPIPSDLLPAKRKIIEMVRLATIHLGGIGTVKSAYDASGLKDVRYASWLQLFNGDLRKFSKASTLAKYVPKIVTTSGIVSEAEAIVAIEDIAIEEEEMKYQREVEQVGLFPWGIYGSPTDPFEASAILSLKGQVRKALHTLTPREQKVLMMRHGIGSSSKTYEDAYGNEPRRWEDYAVARTIFGEDEDAHTRDEIALDFKVEESRIRDIEGKSLRKLKHNLRAKHLRMFIE